MRVFFSGNEELARHHLPIVQSVANSFAERCKKAGLSQNAMAFSFNDTGAHASIQYVFGQLNVQISAPFTTSEGGTITETFKSKKAIWIRTFDEDVWYSYNGMFFSLWDFIEPIYEPSELKITDVEQHIAVDAGARTITPVKWSIQFTKILGPYGIDTAFAECLYQKAGSVLQYVGSENVVEGFAYGYPACAFYVPRANEMLWQAGGDAVFKEEFPVVKGEHTFDTMTSFSYGVYASGFGGFTATYLLGPSWADYEEDFRSQMSAVGVDPDYAADWFFGSGPRPAVTSTLVYLASEFTTFYYEGSNNTSLSITRDPTTGGWDGVSTCVGRIIIISGEGAFLTVKMLDVDGTCISESLPATIVDAYTIGADGSFLEADGGSSAISFVIDARGAALPKSVSGAPRGFIYFNFGGGQRAIAWSRETGWRKCTPPDFLYSEVMPVILWGTYADFYLRYFPPIWNRFNATFQIGLRSYNPANEKFSYPTFIEMHTQNGADMRNLPMGVVILSENARYVSLYNCHSYQNGIYDIRSGTFNSVHLYDDTEIEPIFMDDVAGVICTKRAIYLDHGARSLLCTECCGMFLDHTHYVDKLTDGSFVLNKIVEEDGLHGEVVDSLQAGAYNFYEFSEDASVCIISNYYMYPEDPQPSSPAIVLDYADPVYRFEPSDQIILQYMSPQLYEPTDENREVGYPTGVPFGARYINICKCFYDGVRRVHSTYMPPPRGFTTHTAMIFDEHSYLYCKIFNESFMDFRTKRPTIVPQYSTAAVNRRDYRYDEKRLNRHIYHHTGKILRRISEELEPIDVEFETTITRSV